MKKIRNLSMIVASGTFVFALIYTTLGFFASIEGSEINLNPDKASMLGLYLLFPAVVFFLIAVILTIILEYRESIRFQNNLKVGDRVSVRGNTIEGIVTKITGNKTLVEVEVEKEILHEARK